MKFTGNAKSDPNTTYPADDYFLTCTHVQHLDKDGNALKSKKGNDMWVLELTVAEGPHKDRKQWHYLVWLPAGAPGHGMVLKALKAFGLNPEGENEILPDHLLNVTVKARVKIDEGDGTFDPKNVVAKWFTPDELAKPGAADAEAGSAQEPDEATSFDPKKLEQPAAKQAVPQGPPPQQAAPTKKPLWGAKK